MLGDAYDGFSALAHSCLSPQDVSGSHDGWIPRTVEPSNCSRFSLSCPKCGEHANYRTAGVGLGESQQKALNPKP